MYGETSSLVMEEVKDFDTDFYDTDFSRLEIWLVFSSAFLHAPGLSKHIIYWIIYLAEIVSTSM